MAEPTRSSTVLRDQISPGPQIAAEDGDFIAPGTPTIHVDAQTGAVMEQGDGGATIIDFRPGAKAQKRFDRIPGVEAKFDENLADTVQILDLATIATRVLEGIENDIRSRAEWEATANKGADMLGVKLEEPSIEVGGNGTLSKVYDTLILESVVSSWANTRAELLPAGGPVKVKDDHVSLEDQSQPQTENPNAPKPPSRSEMASALEADFNHYLTVVDKDYYPDFSRMLISRNLIGLAFRKVYRCPLLRRPVSRWVKGTDLIVSNDASSLTGAGRVTERIVMRQSVVKRLQKQGHWRDVALTTPTETPTPTDEKVAQIEGISATTQLPADHRHTIYECYCELDLAPLDGDENGNVPGWPLPYRVTMDRDSRQILEIRRNWKEGDEDFTPRRRYVKYGFVPGLGFYDWGFVHMLGNPERACTAIQRMGLDAGMFNSFPGGLMAKGPGTRQRTVEVRVPPGAFEVIDTGGVPIQQFAMALPYKGMDAQLNALGDKIRANGQKLAGTVNMPVGEGRVGDVPVQTVMAYIETVTKVPSAIHKDDHAAQQEEFELLKELFMEEPEALTKWSKSPARRLYSEQELNDSELVPAADPNVPSQIHRVMQATAQVQMAGLPQFHGIADQRAVWEKANRVLGTNPSEVTMAPQPATAPPPDPKVIAAQLKAQSDEADNNTKLQVAKMQGESRQAELVMERQNRAEDNASEERRAEMSLAGKQAHEASQERQHMAGIVSGHVQHLNEQDTAHAELAQQDLHHQEDLAAQPGIAPDTPQP